MEGMLVQVILVIVQVFSVLVAILVAICSSRQNTRALNVDINFRALDRRKALFQKLQSELRFFTHELSANVEVHSFMTESEKCYKSMCYDEELDMFGSPFPEVYDFVRIQEQVLLLIDEAALIFPEAKGELLIVKDHIADLIKFVTIIVNDNYMVQKKMFEDSQRKCDATAKQAFHKMEKYMDISQFVKTKNF